MKAIALKKPRIPLVWPLFKLLVAGLTVVSVLSLNRELISTTNRGFENISRDNVTSASFRWHPDLFRILSFGHEPASVDWLLIRFLTDSNIAKIKDDKETELSRLLNLATDVDPAFFMLYTAGANYLAVIRNDLQGARKLLEKGAHFLRADLPHYPESFRQVEWGDAWRLLMIQGYLYLFEFQDIESAAKAYSEMDQYPSVAESMRGLAKSIRTTEGQFKISLNSIAVIQGWYKDDPLMTEELKRKEQILKLGQSLDRWNRDFLSFKHAKAESTARRFQRFKAEVRIPEQDSFGGRIFLNEHGRIDSSTPRGKIFGITF